MQPTRILLVEDERIVALHLRQQLSKLGYEVVGVVASGEQALEKVHELQPDVVLMDIHIEGELDGIETAAQIPEDLQIPVVYLTAYSEEATLARARATKPYGYLLKPFSERELHATIQMVLERRAAELALRDSEERLRLALDAAEMGSWELDTSTHRLLRVGRADRIFGFTPEVFSGTWEAFLDQVHEDERALVSGAFNRVLEESALCQLEFRSVRPGGSVRWLKVQGKMFPARAGGAKRIIGVVQDVTERRKAEDRLRQAATALEATTDGILILDEQLRVVSANHGYCAMTGSPEQELLGSRSHLLTSEALPADTFRAFSQALAERGQWRSEIHSRRKSGEEFPVLANIVAVAGERERLTHYVAVFTDMTAVRKAEDDLQHLAHYDQVTELPNRLLAVDRLEQAIERAVRRGDGWRCSLSTSITSSASMTLSGMMSGTNCYGPSHSACGRASVPRIRWRDLVVMNSWWFWKRSSDRSMSEESRESFSMRLGSPFRWPERRSPFPAASGSASTQTTAPAART
jgi:PAS domain S-box-containing protein